MERGIYENGVNHITTAPRKKEKDSREKESNISNFSCYNNTYTFLNPIHTNISKYKEKIKEKKKERKKEIEIQIKMPKYYKNTIPKTKHTQLTRVFDGV